MKKFILIAAAAAACTMCKKWETVSSSAGAAADSAFSAAPEKTGEVQDQADAAPDSARVRIKDFENARNEVNDGIENTSKIVDSLSEKISNVSLRSQTGKIDSARKDQKIVVNVPAPKVIRETRVVYKNQPEKTNPVPVTPKNRLVKTGTLEIRVDDAETAKELVKEEVARYDGFITSENISVNSDDKKTAYLKIKVPLQKFDYLMSDLNYLVGEIENKSIDVTGQEIAGHTLCNLDITLYGNTGNGAGKKKPETFGERSFAAVSSGWDVITSIFLFLLPLWPLFLVAGAGYYFYRKRNPNSGQ